jgi:hypothetical protein
MALDCPKLAAAVCAYGARCLPGFLEETTCVKGEQTLCEHEVKVNGFVNASLPQACGDAYTMAACTGAQTPPELAKDECIRKGTLETGTACEYDGQCKTGNCFRPYGGCGKCAAFGVEGADCTMTTLKCAPGLVCADAKCRKPSALGEACVRTSCAYPNKCIGGKCAAPLADTTACTKNATDDDPCEHRCNSGTCGPSPSRFVEANEKCDGSTLICPAGTSCHGPTNDDRTCLLDAYAGEACDADKGPECAQTLACVNGKCEERPLDACK